jgi:hypothetical protein
MSKLGLEVATVEQGLEVVRNSDSKLLLLVGGPPSVLRASATDLASAQEWRAVDLNVQLAQAVMPLTASERRERAWETLEVVCWASALGRWS